MYQTSLFHTTFLFLMVMDPLGNIPIFVSLLRPFDAQSQKRIIMREMLIALVVMILFLFFGQAIFKILHLHPASLQIAGGIILFMIAINMVFSVPHREKVNRSTKDPLIVPLAIPSVAGPGILATISLYGGNVDHSGKLVTLFAIIIAWIILLPILLLSSNLKKALGENGLVATERLFGYLIILIAMQMMINGLKMHFPQITP
jgi:multiple antibiotic resistance protein